jgi:hypothetical protein
LSEELEEVRFPIRYRDDRHARGGALDRLAQRHQPLRALFLLDRGDLQALDLLLIVFLGDLPSCPDTLAQDPERHTRGREGQRVVHDQAPVMRAVALADRSQAAGLCMRAVRKKYRILHDQHRATAAGDALRSRLPMRLENPRRTRLRVVEQPIRRLRARPIAARLVDRRGRRLGQLFRGFEQATVQAFVAQVSAGKLLRHPLDRLCAGLDDSLHLRILASPRLSQTVRHLAPHAATKARLRNATVCVQRFFRSRQKISENRSRCV